MATRDCCQPGGQARIIANVTCSLSTVYPPVIKSLECVCGDEQHSHHRHAAHRRHSQGREPNIKYQRMIIVLTMSCSFHGMSVTLRSIRYMILHARPGYIHGWKVVLWYGALHVPDHRHALGMLVWAPF